MRYPKFLEENGTIGFVAPSFGCNTEPYYSGFQAALKKFHEMGYQTAIGPNCYAGEGIGISNIPELCGAELNQWYTDDKSDVLISCGGGELMCEMVPFIDFEEIKEAKPKWFVGYSDCTNFTFLLATIADTASFYGQCASIYGMSTWHPSLQAQFDVMTGKTNVVESYAYFELEGLKDEEHPYAPFHTTEKVEMSHYVPAEYDEKVGIQMSGRLIGGCLDVLNNICGTRFDKVREFNERYQDDGIIWFIEACDLNLMGIRRVLWQLKNAGWFEHLRGFVIGRPRLYHEEMFGIDQYRAFVDPLKEFGVPIIMDADIGHLPPTMPIVCGSTADIAYKDNHLTITYTWK